MTNHTKKGDSTNLQASPLVWLFLVFTAALIIALFFEAWGLVVETWEFNPISGSPVAALGLVVLPAVFLWIAIEAWGLYRLCQRDELQHDAKAALALEKKVAVNGVNEGNEVAHRIVDLYAGRDELRDGCKEVKNDLRKIPVRPPSARFKLVGVELLSQLDRDAETEIKATIRKVAVATAIVPIGLVDVVVTLVANLRMIRAIAKIYGNRCGALGAWVLAREVVGSIAVAGVAGGALLAKFAVDSIAARIAYSAAEGAVNGMMTARVGLAVMKVCRPLPFVDGKEPKLFPLLKDALVGALGETMDSIFKREQNIKAFSPDGKNGGPAN